MLFLGIEFGFLGRYTELRCTGDVANGFVGISSRDGTSLRYALGPPCLRHNTTLIFI
jgi:hypothetical protein